MKRLRPESAVCRPDCMPSLEYAVVCRPEDGNAANGGNGGSLARRGNCWNSARALLMYSDGRDAVIDSLFLHSGVALSSYKSHYVLLKLTGDAFKKETL